MQMPTEQQQAQFDAYIITVWQLALLHNKSTVWHEVAESFKRSMYYFNYNVIPKVDDADFVHELHCLRLVARERCNMEFEYLTQELVIDGESIPDFKL